MTDKSTDSVPEEIKTATGWKSVYKQKSGYVIIFRDVDAGKIQGLSKNEDTFFLTFESLNSTPICFHVIRNNSHFQYWTLNKQLHRSNDNPAYIMLDQDNKRHHQRWFWHGLMHRLDRPAEEAVMGYNTIDSETGSHIREEFQKIEMEWWVEGIRSNGIDGMPIWASLEDGWRYKNKTTGKLDWSDDWPALYAKKARVEWTNPRARIVEYWDRKSCEELRPTSLLTTALSEYYNQGNIIDRSCSHLEIQWSHGGRDLENYSENMIKFNDVIKTDLFKDIKLLDGKVFDNAETEIIVLSEYNRIFNE